ncbi:MAG: hypothetical protein CL607_29050 [Anaerolineaceae bacterium]|nr:hypothetical protein [Anaerolineaceae bacterium]
MPNRKLIERHIIHTRQHAAATFDLAAPEVIGVEFLSFLLASRLAGMHLFYFDAGDAIAFGPGEERQLLFTRHGVGDEIQYDVVGH